MGALPAGAGRGQDTTEPNDAETETARPSDTGRHSRVGVFDVLTSAEVDDLVARTRTIDVGEEPVLSGRPGQLINVVVIQHGLVHDESVIEARGLECGLAGLIRTVSGPDPQNRSERVFVGVVARVPTDQDVVACVAD